MKKVIYTIAFILAGTGVSIANSENGHKNEKIDSAKVERTAEAEAKFTASFAKESKELIVNVSGILDPYASVSVTNLRGTTIQYSLIQEKSGEFYFDLSKLEAGVYNVMLITQQEIRIKRIQVG